MANTLLLAAHAGGAATTANTTQYWQPGSCCVVNSTTETTQQVVIRSAGNLSKLSVYIGANSVGSGTSTWTLRKNAADATNVVSVAASSTGWFEDTTHTDAVVAGDKIAVKSIHGAVTGTMTVTQIVITYAATTDTVQRLVALTGRATVAEPLTRFFALNHGSANFGTAEAAAKCRMRKAGTFKNAAVNVSANGITTASTYTTRKNAANTTVTISITASTTGFFEDTTHSFTVVAGDDVNHQLVTPSVSGTPTITIQSMQIDLVSTAGEGMLVNADEGTNSFGPSVTNYTTLTGGTGLSGTEAVCQLLVRASYTFSELTILVNTNSLTSATTLRTRKNGANGNLSVSITASTSGIFSDSTHTDAVVSGDLICNQFVSVAGGTSLNYYGVYISTLSSVGQTFIVNLSDTLTASETRTIKATKARTDTLSFTETRLIKAIKLRSDTNSISELLSRFWIHVRTLSDTLSKSEALIKKAVKLRSDTLAKSETLTKKAIISRAETMAKSESLTKKSIMPRSETFAKSESMIKKAIKLRSDTLAKSETLTKKAIIARTETAAKSEALLKKVIIFRSETLAKSESLTKIVKIFRSDTYSKSESIIIKAIKLLSDTLGVSETLTGTKIVTTIVRTLSDTYGRSESIIKIAKMGLSDIYGVSETRGVLRQFYRNLSDSYDKSETLQKVATKIRSDVGGFNEGLLKRVSRYLEDTYNKSESLTSIKTFYTILRTLSDTYTAAELLTKNVTHYLEDIIGGGGGFKQFVHQIVDTYIATETLESFVFRIAQPFVYQSQRIQQQVAKDVKLSWQRRLVKQPIDTQSPLTSNKTIVRTLTDSYSSTENIQTNVFRERIITKVQVAGPKVDKFLTLGRQLPASLITETIIKKLNEHDPQTALAFRDHLKIKEQEDKTVKVVKQIEQSIKLITKDNDESRIMKARKLGKLMKLNKLIDLIRRVNYKEDE